MLAKTNVVSFISSVGCMNYMHFSETFGFVCMQVCKETKAHTCVLFFLNIWIFFFSGFNVIDIHEVFFFFFFFFFFLLSDNRRA